MFKTLRDIYQRYTSAKTVEELPIMMAGRILEAAYMATRAVEDRMASKSADGRPLYVLLGEHHDLATHKLAQMRLVHNLQNAGYKVAVGFENSYNLAQTTNERLRQQDPSPLAEIMAEQLQITPHGSHLHMMMAGHGLMTPEAYLTNKERLRVFTDAGVNMAMNDAARSDLNTGRQLDMTDDHLLDIMHKNGIEAGDEAIDAFSTQGIFLRNQVMKAMATEHATLVQPDIYIQICGALHLAGHANPGPELGKVPYSQSLTAAYEADGDHVLAVPLFNDVFTEECLPPDRSSAVVKGPRLQGPVFKGMDNTQEAMWLTEVLRYVLPQQELEQALPSPAVQAKSRSLETGKI